MRIHVLDSMATAGLIAALSILGLACGGDKDATDTSAGADTDTDTDADADTDTDVPVTTGFARVTNLLVDHTATDIHLNDAADPLNPDPFPLGGNTDATDLDYVPFPPGDYKVDLRNNPGGDVILVVDPVTVELGAYITVVAMGSETVAALDPSLGPAGVVVTDDLSAPGAGNHRVTFFNSSPGTPPLGVWFGDTATATGTPDVTSYGAWTTWTITSGATTLYLDADMDNVADQTYSIDLADDGWSYIYTMPDPLQTLPTGSIIHHVRGVDNNQVLPD